MERWHNETSPAAGAAQGELLKLMEEWRRLTEGEQEAIQREDWAKVAEQQACKQRLSELMTLARERQRPERSTNPAPSGAERRFREVLAEVVALEQRNSEILSDKRQRRRAELESMSQATRHLQGVRRAYGSCNQHRWQSYS